MAKRPTLEALLKLLTAEMQSAFLMAIQGVVDQVILAEVIDAIVVGDAERAFELLGFNPGALRPITNAIERMYEQSGDWTADGYPRQPGYPYFRFDVKNPTAEKWMKDKSSELISRLTDEARTNVRTTLQDAIQRGRNPRNTALDIVGKVNRQTGKREGGTIGLTVNQENWVRSLRTNLEQLNPNYFTKELRDKRFDPAVKKAIDSNTPLAADVVDKLVDRYRSNALKYRGEMIARTESIHAFNAAELESARQVVATGAVRDKDVKREWDSAGDRKVRPAHKVMDGQQVGLDEPFRSPDGAFLMYPGDTTLGAPASDVINCRCRVKTVIDWIGAAVGD